MSSSYSSAPLPAHFPHAHLDPKELLYVRSWQATPLVTFFYYWSILSAVAYLITAMVQYTVLLGVGGFFYGLLVGALTAVAIVLGARIACEVVLSIFSIRDHIAAGGHRSAGSPDDLPEPTIPAPSPMGYQAVHVAPANYARAPNQNSDYETL